MYACAKIKRVSYPLDEEARARIIGADATPADDVSSGSEHGGVDAESLSDLFYGCSVGDDAEWSPEGEIADSERDRSMYDSICRNVDLVEAIVLDQSDEFKILLRNSVLKALQVFGFVKSDGVMLRRNVMAYLRDRGYNVAICKTRWESVGGLTAGGYEFIDVVRKDDSAARYFVDLDFAAEFEIARPTNSYKRLLRCLPAVFVGDSEDLKQILKAMSDAARRSMKCGGLLLPPWRKHRFMQNKWFGPYRRTAKLFPTSFCSTSSSSSKRSFAVKRCAVGFNVAVDGVRLWLPSTARTR